MGQSSHLNPSTGDPRLDREVADADGLSLSGGVYLLELLPVVIQRWLLDGFELGEYTRQVLWRVVSP